MPKRLSTAVVRPLRAYRKPRLRHLGTLTEVTQLTGTMGANADGHNTNKTV